MEHIVEIIIAVIGSGSLSALITGILGRRKYRTEVDALKQDIEAAKTDNQIKLDEHIKLQFMEITNSYKEATKNIKAELVEAQRQNTELIGKINHCQIELGAISVKITQLMSWCTYDMLHYQHWIETELKRLKPDIEFPEHRKPPKFLQEYIEQELQKNDEEDQ